MWKKVEKGSNFLEVSGSICLSLLQGLGDRFMDKDLTFVCEKPDTSGYSLILIGNTIQQRLFFAPCICAALYN